VERKRRMGGALREEKQSTENAPAEERVQWYMEQ
jgi:hypothetical protein